MFINRERQFYHNRREKQILNLIIPGSIVHIKSFPARQEIQKDIKLDSRFRGNDGIVVSMDSRFEGNNMLSFPTRLGIQKDIDLDSRFHGNDGIVVLLTSH